jgi:hypothetical protein
MKILVRFEADACTVSADDLKDAFSQLSMKPKSAVKAAASPSHPLLTIRHNADLSPVPQSSIIELATRAAHKEMDIDDIYPQLYFSQTPSLYVAKHNRGTFFTVDEIALASERVVRSAAKAEANMRRLRKILGEIVDLVKKSGDGVQLSLVCTDGALALFKQKGRSKRSISEADARKFCDSSTDNVSS